MTKWWEEINQWFGKTSNTYFIYQIACANNGKRYIGRTRSVRTRIMNHLSCLRSGKHPNADLQNDFDLYGENAFSFLLLEISEKEINCNGGRERYWMDRFKTFDREYGYNQNDAKFRTQKWFEVHQPNRRKRCSA